MLVVKLHVKLTFLLLRVSARTADDIMPNPCQRSKLLLSNMNVVEGDIVGDL